MNVHQHDVRLALARAQVVERRLAVGHRADDFDRRIRIEQMNQIEPRDVRVVGDRAP